MTDPRIILIRYDEIGLKGKNRRFFENCLRDNIRKKLSGIQIDHLRMPRGRIIIEADQSVVDECVERLCRVPGVASLSVGIFVNHEFDAMAEVGIRWIENRLRDAGAFKFCVRTHRAFKSFPQTSPEINFEVGSRIMRRLSTQGLTVDIKGAEFVLEVEVRQEGAIVFNNRVPGLRGLPVGSAGEVLTLLSGGIDSPVAAFRLICRGCRSHFIFFDNRTFLGRGGFDKVLRIAKVLNTFQTKGRLYVVPFSDMQVVIRDRCRAANRIVLYRRMMYRIAHAISEQNVLLGLVTGESLGQVASQTLENLAAVSCVVPISVFRPLIGTDKLEIINQAKKIGTYEISIEPQPDCCSVFMPPNPATRGKIPELEFDEEKFPWQSLMKEALEQTEVIELDTEET